MFTCPHIRESAHMSWATLSRPSIDDNIHYFWLCVCVRLVNLSIRYRMVAPTPLYLAMFMTMTGNDLSSRYICQYTRVGPMWR